MDAIKMRIPYLHWLEDECFLAYVVGSIFFVPTIHLRKHYTISLEAILSRFHTTSLEVSNY